MGVGGEEERDSLVFQCGLLPSGLIELWEERTRVCCLLSSHIWHQSRVLTWNCTLTWHGTQNAFVVSVIQVTRSFIWSHISQALTSQFPFESKPTNVRQIHAHLMSTWLGHAHNYTQLSLSLFMVQTVLVSWRDRRNWRDVFQTRPCLQSSDWPIPKWITFHVPVSLSLCVCTCVLRPINLTWFLRVGLVSWDPTSRRQLGFNMWMRWLPPLFNKMITFRPDKYFISFFRQRRRTSNEDGERRRPEGKDRNVKSSSS